MGNLLLLPRSISAVGETSVGMSMWDFPRRVCGRRSGAMQDVQMKIRIRRQAISHQGDRPHREVQGEVLRRVRRLNMEVLCTSTMPLPQIARDEDRIDRGMIVARRYMM